MREDPSDEDMQAWEVTGEHGSKERIRLQRRAIPVPRDDEVLLQVEACGVCRTDLHVADGDLPVHRARVVPGHEVVGTVITTPPGGRFTRGDRVGVAWLRRTCGECRWCRRGSENLCPHAQFTGWDADGGYAEYATVPEAFAYRIPTQLAPVDAAPLLCAGIIGYRALCRAALPPGGRLGIYGFGASAHLTAQLALAQGAEVHVLTRGEDARALALEVGAASAGSAFESPPVPLDAAILFAPAGELVPVALDALDRAGRLVLAGIHVSEIPPLDYRRHLFLEKEVVSVTANTRADGEDFLALAGRLGIVPTVSRWDFRHADAALAEVAEGGLVGVAVLSSW